MSIKILAVEDELYMCKLYEETLGKGRFDVIVHDNWADAQVSLEKEDFSLILLDIGLPDKDGVEILAEIRRKDQEIPIIMVSAYGTKDRIVESSQHKISDFIVKPFKIPVLREKITRILKIDE